MSSRDQRVKFIAINQGKEHQPG